MHFRVSIAQIILIVVTIINCAEAYSRQQVDNTITVSYVDIPLKKVLKDLTKQTGIRFSYSSKKIPVNTPVTYSAKEKPSKVVVEEILDLFDIEFEQVESQLVLYGIKADVITDEANKPPPKKEIKKHTLSGYLYDKDNRESLIGAVIYIKEKETGIVTNTYGFYSITLPEGDYTIEAGYLGYAVSSQSIKLDKNQVLDIDLVPTASQLEEVVIVSRDNQEVILKKHAAESSVDLLQIRKQAAVMGETDIIKSLDNLPGISFHGDGSSFFYVRGGDRDQNLVLLDGATIYNPTHLLGLFTPIIPEAIKSTTVYKANFPIEYGGRVSSLIDIHTNDGDMSEFTAHLSIGLMATRASFEGPIKKDRSSYFISMRRSYFGALFKAVNDDIKDFYFSDVTAKFNTKLGDKNRLFVTFYRGADVFKVDDGSESVGIGWENSLLSLRWNHVFNERLFSNTTLYTSAYDYKLYTSVADDYYWNSSISNLNFKNEFTYFLLPGIKIKSGLKLASYTFNPGNFNNPDIPETMQVSMVNSLETVFYTGFEHELTSRLFINYGIRFTHWANYGEAFVVNYTGTVADSVSYYEKGEKYYSNWQPEPRISLSYSFTELTALKLSYNRTLQHINMISNNIGPFNSLDVWLPSGPNKKPQKADIFNIGILKNTSNQKYEFGADVFYKKLYNLIGYRYHAEMILNPYLEGELLQGNGSAYGFEISATKLYGRFNGQVAYTYSRSKVQIDGLNDGELFYTRQDRPHDFNIAMNYRLRPKWDISVNGIFASGMRTTSPTSFYTYDGYQVPVYAEQNNTRMPMYKRIDISTDLRLGNSKKIEQKLTFALYNALGHKNPIFINYNKVYDSNIDNWLIPADNLKEQELSTTQRYFYWVIPSLTYYLTF